MVSGTSWLRSAIRRRLAELKIRSISEDIAGIDSKSRARRRRVVEPDVLHQGNTAFLLSSSNSVGVPVM